LVGKMPEITDHSVARLTHRRRPHERTPFSLPRPELSGHVGLVTALIGLIISASDVIHFGREAHSPNDDCTARNLEVG